MYRHAFRGSLAIAYRFYCVQAGTWFTKESWDMVYTFSAPSSAFESTIRSVSS